MSRHYYNRHLHEDDREPMVRCPGRGCGRETHVSELDGKGLGPCCSEPGDDDEEDA